jgi:hypothetical protein
MGIRFPGSFGVCKALPFNLEEELPFALRVTAMVADTVHDIFVVIRAGQVKKLRLGEVWRQVELLETGLGYLQLGLGDDILA